MVKCKGGKNGHSREYKRFTSHALGFSISFQMKSWMGEYRQGAKKIILCSWSDVNIDKNKWILTIALRTNDDHHETKMPD